MPQASIDIGSNSMVFLVVGDDGDTIHDEANVVGLGQGIGRRGIFQPDRMEAAIGVFHRYAETAQKMGVDPGQIKAVATSASRRAMNSESFFSRVTQETGIKVQVISGEREAQLTWRGALLGLPIEPGPYAVVDLGGGSTEFVVGDPGVGSLVEQRSVEIGTVRLTEKFLAHSERYSPADLAKMRKYIEESLSEVDWRVIPKALIAVAGTATTICAMELGLTEWDRSRVHGSRLNRAALRRWIDKLLFSTPAQRKEWAAVSPERSEHLLAGACVLEAVCTASHRDSLWISDGGVRHGVLLEG